MPDTTPRVRTIDRENEGAALVPLDRLVNGDRPADEIQSFYRDYGGTILVAEISQEIVGYATLSYPYWNRVAMMDHIAVSADWRKAGVGRALCTAIEDLAREREARIISVQTALWNFDAVRFYERVGYAPRAVLAGYLGEGNDLVWLDKALEVAR